MYKKPGLLFFVLSTLTNDFLPMQNPMPGASSVGFFGWLFGSRQAPQQEAPPPQAEFKIVVDEEGVPWRVLPGPEAVAKAELTSGVPEVSAEDKLKLAAAAALQRSKQRSQVVSAPVQQGGPASGLQGRVILDLQEKLLKPSAVKGAERSLPPEKLSLARPGEPKKDLKDSVAERLREILLAAREFAQDIDKFFSGQPKRLAIAAPPPAPAQATVPSAQGPEIVKTPAAEAPPARVVAVESVEDKKQNGASGSESEAEAPTVLDQPGLEKVDSSNPAPKQSKRAQRKASGAGRRRRR